MDKDTPNRHGLGHRQTKQTQTQKDKPNKAQTPQKDMDTDRPNKHGQT